MTDHEYIAIGKAITRANEELPEGWKMRIFIERRSASVDLFDPDNFGKVHSIECSGEPLSVHISCGTEFATLENAKRGGMSERKMVELAGKAAKMKVGISGYESHRTFHDRSHGSCGEFHCNWDPINNEDDALRLAAKLGIDAMGFNTLEGRKRIVLAAAKIGEAMQ